MSNAGYMTYDHNGHWVHSNDNAGNTSTSNQSTTKSGNSSGSSASTPSPSGGSQQNSGNSAMSSSNTDGNSSTGKTEKKYNTIIINTLQGTLSFIATEKTIKLNAGDTVKLEGLGRYLSGNYYVKDITRSIGANGYSHNATLIKTDFGKSLKPKKKILKRASNNKNNNGASPATGEYTPDS